MHFRPPTSAFRLPILALGLAFAGAIASAQQPVFRGTGDTVRLFATVMDRDGRLVTTLTQDQFEVRDEGKPQPITVFDNSPQPIRLVVMLDVSGSMQGNLPLLRASVEQLIARLRTDDEVRLGSFGHEVTIDDRVPDAIAPDAPTPLWRALDEAIQALTKEGDERRVVLVLSDGKDSGLTSFRERFVSQGEVIDRARANDVMIYAVGMRSRGRRTIQPGIGGLQAALADDLPDPGLARVAEDTGGGYTELTAGQDLGAAFAAIADELHRQYLIGFDPPKKDGKVHHVEVRVSVRGLKSRARKSYVAPKD